MTALGILRVVVDSRTIHKQKGPANFGVALRLDRPVDLTDGTDLGLDIPVKDDDWVYSRASGVLDSGRFGAQSSGLETDKWALEIEVVK